MAAVADFTENDPSFGADFHNGHSAGHPELLTASGQQLIGDNPYTARVVLQLVIFDQEERNSICDSAVHYDVFAFEIPRVVDDVSDLYRSKSGGWTRGRERDGGAQ